MSLVHGDLCSLSGVVCGNKPSRPRKSRPARSMRPSHATRAFRVGQCRDALYVTGVLLENLQRDYKLKRVEDKSRQMERPCIVKRRLSGQGGGRDSVRLAFGS